MSPRPSSRSAPFMSRIDARIDLRADREGDARRDVRFDQPGDDVDRRALRRDDQVDAGRARELREAHDRRFDFRRRDEHEIGELVDDDHDVGQRFVGILRVVLLDLAHAGFREPLVARVHLLGHLEERAGGEARIGDHLFDEMRNAVVDGQFDALWDRSSASALDRASR